MVSSVRSVYAKWYDACAAAAYDGNDDNDNHFKRM